MKPAIALVLALASPISEAGLSSLRGIGENEVKYAVCIPTFSMITF